MVGVSEYPSCKINKVNSAVAFHLRLHDPQRLQRGLCFCYFVCLGHHIPSSTVHFAHREGDHSCPVLDRTRDIELSINKNLRFFSFLLYFSTKRRDNCFIIHWRIRWIRFHFVNISEEITGNTLFHHHLISISLGSFPFLS